MTAPEKCEPEHRQVLPVEGRPSTFGLRAIGRRLRVPPVLGFVLGLAGAATLAGFGHLRAGPLEPTGDGAASLVARVARIEARLDTIPAAAGPARRAEPNPVVDGPGHDRFVAAALLLQAAVSTPRPWLREYRAMLALAPPGALPEGLAEVLLSHAARGLPTEAELRERYAVLMPQLIERAPQDVSLFERGYAAMRSVFSGIGLATPPAPSDQEQAISGVAQQLRRGNLAAAVADAGALPEALLPLLAGWLAQAGARLAVEQAVQETLLRALTAQPRPG